MSNTGITLIKTMRLPFLVLTPACVLVGIGAAMQLSDSINLQHVLLVFIGALCAHISANTFNEYFDFTSGLDTITIKTPFSGGSGGLVAYPSAQPMVLVFAVATLMLTTFIGIYLLQHASALLLVVGALGFFLIIAYTRWINTLPLFCLITPGLAFGPLFIFGTIISVTEINILADGNGLFALGAALVPFFLVNNLLLLNQLPDVEADRQVGRLTFPIVYGKTNSLRVYGIFTGATALVISIMVAAGLIGWLGLLALLPLVIAIFVFKGIMKEDYATEKIIPYLGQNVALVLITNFMWGGVLCVDKLI